jgi:hypothetical protein
MPKYKQTHDNTRNTRKTQNEIANSSERTLVYPYRALSQTPTLPRHARAIDMLAALLPYIHKATQMNKPIVAIGVLCNTVCENAE